MTVEVCDPSRSQDSGRRTVELLIPARTEFLALARLVVVAAASAAAGFTDDRLDDLRLAVSEACANAIEANTHAGSRDRVRIRAELTEDRVLVEVEDHGEGFDPADVVTLPDPSDPARLDYESGLGIPLMRALTDQTEIVSSPQGTLVRLVMYGMSQVR